MEYETTYRLVGLIDGEFGRTAATPEMAKLAPGQLNRAQRLGLERTEWVEQNFRPRANRSILIETEERPGEWTLGTDQAAL
jgi:hypothetical protein